MAHIEDRWQDKDKVRTDRWGTGKRYRARYADPSGRERSRSFDKKGDAETFLANISSAMLRGEYVDPQAGRVTLNEYGREWLAARDFSEGTRERVEMRLRVHVYPKLGDKTLTQLALRPSLIQSWLAALPLGARSKLNVLDHLSAIMSAAVGDGLILRNPCKVKAVVKRPRPVKTKLVPWDVPTVALIRAGMPEHLRAMCDVGAGLGLRQGEAFALSPDDIDWLRGIVHVQRQVKNVGSRLCFALPKYDRERDIPLPESVKLRLSAHLEAFPAPSVTLPRDKPGGPPVTASIIFATQSRTALSRSWFDTWPWDKAREAAKVERGPGTGFHALRHHFASVLLRDGVDIRALAEYMGHHDPGFTLRTYVHLMPGSEEKMRMAVDRALNGESEGPETAQSEVTGL